MTRRLLGHQHEKPWGIQWCTSRSSDPTAQRCRATTRSSSAGRSTPDNPLNYGTVSREGNTNADGVGIGGGVAGYEGITGHVTFYVEVPDVAAALAQAESLGGKRLMGPVEIVPGTTIAQFTDPEGHMVGLVSPS